MNFINHQNQIKQLPLSDFLFILIPEIFIIYLLHIFTNKDPFYVSTKNYPKIFSLKEDKTYHIVHFLVLKSC